MRFPLALSLKIARHILRHKLRGTAKFALVLQLEPLYNFGPRPARSADGAKVKAFNGAAAGKGHLAEAGAANQGAARSNGAGRETAVSTANHLRS